MNLRAALRMSEFRKARITHNNVLITVEQVERGYMVSYSGKQVHYLTFEALAVFLGREVVTAEWTPIQSAE